jgi:trehalose transport system permease protein
MKRKYYLLLMITPAFLYILAFTIRPVFSAFKLSLTNRSGDFTLGNFVKIFSQSNFTQALWNNFFISIVGLLLQLVVALYIANILSRNFFGRGVFRSIVILPLGVPTIVSATIMLCLFTGGGYINGILYDLGIAEIPRTPIWLAGGWRSVMTIIAADSWKVLPTVILILLSGYESIDKQLYEASNIDGASSRQNFFLITLPLLRPAITAAIILRGVNAFQIFELPMVLVGDSIPVLSTFAYYEYSVMLNDHTSAAASIILFLIILFLTITYLIWNNSKEEKTQ